MLFEFERNLDLKIENLKYSRGAGARGVEGGGRGETAENALCWQRSRFYKNLERLALLFEFERNLNLKIEILTFHFHILLIWVFQIFGVSQENPERH